MENSIPKKTICAHSRGWWTKELGEHTKKVKKAKRLFCKRSNETNYNAYITLMSEFKVLEKQAKNDYLEKLTKLLDPKKPQQFWNVINKSRKNEVKSTIQPIIRKDGSYAISDNEIITEMK